LSTEQGLYKLIQFLAPPKKRLAVQFPTVKFSLYLTKKLAGWSTAFVLWNWSIGLQSRERKEERKKKMKKRKFLSPYLEKIVL
jgi:hypothetical protein